MKVSDNKDNAGEIILFRTLSPEYTPCSKYYATKTVWFCEDINKRNIVFLKISTVDQLGNLLTKGLPRATFEYLRKKVMCW